MTPPRFVGRYTSFGAISAVGAETFDLTVALSEPGSVYYVVVDKGDAPAITAADVRNLRGGAIGDAVASRAAPSTSPRRTPTSR